MPSAPHGAGVSPAILALSAAHQESPAGDDGGTESFTVGVVAIGKNWLEWQETSWET
jgi:hypothetical protein